MSARGKCQECAHAMQQAHIVGMRMHDGPFFQHWRRQMAASVGGVLRDELEQKG